MTSKPTFQTLYLVLFEKLALTCLSYCRSERYILCSITLYFNYFGDYWNAIKLSSFLFRYASTLNFQLFTILSCKYLINMFKRNSIKWKRKVKPKIEIGFVILIKIKQTNKIEWKKLKIITKTNHAISFNNSAKLWYWYWLPFLCFFQEKNFEIEKNIIIN